MGEICLVCIFLIILYFFAVWKKGTAYLEKRGIDMTKRGRFFPGIVLILRFFREKFHCSLHGERFEKLKKFYVGKGEEEIFYLFYGTLGKQISIAVLVLLCLLAGSGLAERGGELIDGFFLQKEGVLGEEKKLSLTARAGSEEKEVEIAVPHKEYTEAERKEKFAEAEQFIKRNYLAENSSAERVSYPLSLPTSIPGSAVKVRWDTDPDGLIGSDGALHNDSLEESCQTQITAHLSYGEQEDKIVLSVTVLPRQRTKEELFWKEWNRQLEKNKEKDDSNYLELPRQVEGTGLSYREKETVPACAILFLGIISLLLIPLLAESRLHRELARRDEQLRMDYPDFIEQFVLLVGAGLNVKGTWERMVTEYQKRTPENESRYLYEEMILSMRDMENGMSESRAYELFGKRTGVLSYMKFSALLVQNLKKGQKDLLKLLDHEMADAFQARKQTAKALGEKAGTKLLLPMMLMLIIVFALILYSAFQNM